MTASRSVIWHDLECGAYDADLPAWRALADATSGPILDVGAGTGRVALDLARRGHDVIALDCDAELLAALAARADGVPIAAVTADARTFALDRSFALVIVPMQTLQLFGGSDERLRFLAAAERHLAPGGRIAIAIADPLEAAGGVMPPPGTEWAHPPLPDMTEIDGTVYASRPVTLLDAGHAIGIERVREVVDDRGGRTEERNVVWLDALTADRLEDEARALGIGVLERIEVAATDEYVGSTVVVLGG